MRIIRTVIVLALVAAAGTWAYYANMVSGKQAMDMSARVSGAASAFPVTLASVERGPVWGSVVYTGSIAAYTEEDVYPRVTGRILEMAVYPGDLVRAGQVVARLDDLELISRVREAEAMAVNALANRSQMEADVAATRYGIAQMEKEMAVAEAESGYQQSVAARDEQLLAKGAVAKQEAESSRAMAVAGQAKVQAARARLEQAKAMESSAQRKLEAADAMVAQGQAQAKTAQVVRDYVNIRATTSGYVVKRLVAPGVLVQPGTPVLKIAQMDKVRLQANVGERDLSGIRVGSPVTVSTTGDGGGFTTTVTSVVPFVDSGARTAVVEAVVENTGRRLLPGQYVQMQFVTGGRQDAVMVPRRAVARMGEKATVWVLKDGDRVEPREVVTGLENSERVEILTGLQGGERVVAMGHEGLYADARVSDVSAGTPASQEATDAHKGMPGMEPPPGKGKQPEMKPEKTTDLKDMAGQAAGPQMAQAGGGAASAGTLQIALASNPVKLSSGKATLRFEVKDATGAPVPDAKVEVSAAMPGMSVPKVTARAAKDPGAYEATVNLGMAGAWTVEVTATRPQGGPTSAKFNFEAK